MPLDDLLREALAAPDDGARAAVAAKLAAVPDAMPEIARMAVSTAPAERLLALQFLTRLAPPPPLFRWAIRHCLVAPLDPDPLGDESALVLVCCAALAGELVTDRDHVAARARAIDAADGPRAAVMRRLAHDTLAALDRAKAAADQRWAAEIAEHLARFVAGDRAGTTLAIERATAADAEPALARSQRWEALGDRLDRAGAHVAYDHALRYFTAYAEHAYAAGEGGERQADIARLAAKRDALTADR